MKNLNIYKIILITFIICFSFIHLYSQTWQNIGGNQSYSPGSRGYYEKLNEYSPKNCPSLINHNYISWNVNNDSIFVLESFTNSDVTKNFLFVDVRFWVFNTQSMQWKCITDRNNAAYDGGIKGVPTANNFPGPRVKAATWVDNENNLWLYSGKENQFSGEFYYCDLWKYIPKTNLWVWVSGELQKLKLASGPKTYNSTGNYESLGVPSKTAFPSDRGFNGLPNSFNDNDGNLILYGGNKSDDIWRYNIHTNEWTWLKGQDPYYVSGTVSQYIDNSGSAPQRSTPGTNKNTIAIWVDEFNDFFSLTHDNDIWKFNHLSTNWERIKKIPYAPLTDFEIESDNSVFQRLENPMSYKIGNYIYVFGGDLGNFKLTNSLFRLNINNFKWTWLRGNTNLNQNNRYELDNNPGFVNVKNEEHNLNLPYSRENGLLWRDKSDNIVLGYGTGIYKNQYYDIWKYNINSNRFSWIGGRINEYLKEPFNNNFIEQKLNNFDTATSFIVKIDYNNQLPLNQIAVGNFIYIYQLYMILRRNIQTNITEVVKKFVNPIEGEEGEIGDNIYSNNLRILSYNMGNIYFVDSRKSILYAHDLTTNKIQCIKKVSTPSHGVINVFAPTNFPEFSMRTQFTSWFDENGDLHLHGGNGYADTWIYKKEINQWAWINGYRSASSDQGINFPRALINPCTWVDNDKNLWLFGGHRDGYGGIVGKLHFNQMWKYNTKKNEWKIIRGDFRFALGDANKSGFPGEIGLISYKNLPSARSKYGTWVDNNNNLWLINGSRRNVAQLAPNSADITKTIEDIWMFETRIRRWTRVSGFDVPVDPDSSSYPFEYNNEKPIVRPFSLTSNDERENENAFTFTFGEKLILSQYNTETLWSFDYKPLTPKYVVFGGTVRYDDNLNGCKDDDLPFHNLKVINNNNNEFTMTDYEGNYFLYDQTLNCNIVAEFAKPYFIINPQDTILNFTHFGQYINLDYCVQPDGYKNDVSITLVPTSNAIIGFNSTYEIILKNEGNQTISGEIKLKFDPLNASYISSLPDTIKADSLNYIWKFENLKPFEKKSINLILKINNSKKLGDTLRLNVGANTSITDLDITDNFFELQQILTSSFDPNDKTILEGALLPFLLK
ncbi:MAG: hypothetical protein IPH93_02545 [Saprospiraceae bacterium]|nr:hypothetical protein [Saprospiraceae bacterium]